MKSKGIVHRDIKGENIVLNPQRQLKLIDFGTARDALDDTIQPTGTGSKGKKQFKHFVGTPNYMPPECIRNIDSNYETDIYALAGTIYQVTTGYPPVIGPSDYIIFEMTQQNEIFFSNAHFGHNRVLQDLLQQMFEKDFTKRITLEEIKKHPYWQDFDFQNILQYDKIRDLIGEKERFLLEFKYTLMKNEKEMEDKEEILKQFFKDIKIKQIQANFNQEDNEFIEKHLQIFWLQAQQLANLSQFDWSLVKE